jgi:hypothetical protein
MGCIDVIIISLLSLFTVKYPAGSGLADMYGRIFHLERTYACVIYISIHFATTLILVLENVSLEAAVQASGNNTRSGGVDQLQLRQLSQRRHGRSAEQHQCRFPELPMKTFYRKLNASRISTEGGRRWSTNV